MRIFDWLLISLPFMVVMTQSESAANRIPEKYQARLDKVFAFRDQVRDIHPALRKVYPIALAEEKTVFIFKPDEAAGKYRLVLTVPDPYDLPRGIRAAMPLGFWNNRSACVVSGEVFDERAGYVMIFHEFVHCAQAETCEQKLKGAIESYQEAIRKKDYMWELQYPFPYQDGTFSRLYGELLKALDGPSGSRIQVLREQLQASITTPQWEYLTWQEWKEGFARYLENQMRSKLKLPENTGGSSEPYNRVTFYYGGDKMIRFLTGVDSSLFADIEKIYDRLALPGGKKSEFFTTKGNVFADFLN
jgi:hypothetical protein